jgi:hypothetical protein
MVFLFLKIDSYHRFIQTKEYEEMKNKYITSTIFNTFNNTLNNLN